MKVERESVSNKYTRIPAVGWYWNVGIGGAKLCVLQKLEGSDSSWGLASKAENFAVSHYQCNQVAEETAVVGIRLDGCLHRRKHHRLLPHPPQFLDNTWVSIRQSR